ncbi:MAG TPA: hypothetical protein VF060_26715 [Trebonia sp.]
MDRAPRLLEPADPRHAPLAEPGRQLLHGGEHEFFLGAEVVLHQPQGHPCLGRDLAHPGGMQPALGGDPQQRVRDLPPPFLVINPLRHPPTVSLVAGRTR